MGLGWFERGGGQSTGRITPERAPAPEGTRVFVLGQEAQAEPARLIAGDLVRLRQVVDLTGVDVVGATMDTFGVALGAFVRSAELTIDPTVYTVHGAWFMNTAWEHAENERGEQPHLFGMGDLALATEDYSDAGSNCRRVPVGSTTAQLEGVNTPQLWGAAALPAYTFDAWLDFDADSVPDSDGVSPTIFACDDGSDGLTVYLSGEGGPGPQHRWWPAVQHRAGGVTEAVLFAAVPITVSDGWHHLTIVYDSALVGADRCKLYVDGLLAGTGGPGLLSVDPGVANLGCPLTIASPALCGRIDQVRLLAEPLDAITVGAEHVKCVRAPYARGALWSMQIRVDDNVYCERFIDEAEQRTWTDFYAPVRHLVGPHPVDFVLQLLEEP